MTGASNIAGDSSVSFLHYCFANNTTERREPRLTRAASLIGLLLVLPLAACGGSEKNADDLTSPSARSAPTQPIVIPAGAPIVVGISMPLTGPVSAAGQEDSTSSVVSINRWKAKNGDRIAGHEIQVRVEDDGCTEGDITEQAAMRLAGAVGVVAVLGPSCSAGAERAIPVYQRAGLVAITGSATKTDLTTSQQKGSFFFRTAYRNDLEGQLIGLYAKFGLNARATWVVDDGEAYGQDLAKAAAEIMSSTGIKVSNESVRSDEKDFRTLVERIKDENPNLVIFAGFNPQAALFYRQLKHARYTGVVGSVDAAASTRNFIEPLGSLAEGALFAGCAVALPDDFVADFVKIHGKQAEDSRFLAQYADAATIVLDAVKTTVRESGDGSLTIDPTALRDAVRATSLTNGLTGSLAFDDNGDRVPHPGDDLNKIVADAVKNQNLDVFPQLGLVPCQVQDAKLVKLLGPGAGQIR